MVYRSLHILKHQQPGLQRLIKHITNNTKNTNHSKSTLSTIWSSKQIPIFLNKYQTSTSLKVKALNKASSDDVLSMAQHSELIVAEMQPQPKFFICFILSVNQGVRSRFLCLVSCVDCFVALRVPFSLFLSSLSCRVAFFNVWLLYF